MLGVLSRTDPAVTVAVINFSCLTNIAISTDAATAEIATVNFFIIEPFFELLLKNDVTAR